MNEELTDDRLRQLIDLLALREGGFCNYTVLVEEVREMATELLHYRDKPLHCPGCDGDHL